MRIAVSGTHGSGKSTLIADFVDAHPQLASGAEPYECLDAPIEGADAASFIRQFTTSVALFGDPTLARDVIFERSPLDFVAYVMALSSLGRPTATPQKLGELLSHAVQSLQQIDLLAVTMLDRHLNLVLEDDEDEELRAAMNAHLLDLLDEAPSEVMVREIAGPREARLHEPAAAYERMSRA